MVRIRKRSKEVGDRIIKDLCGKHKFSDAAMRNGITMKTLSEWMTEDYEFMVRCYQARKADIPKYVRRLIKSSDRGDTKATMYLLERDEKDNIDFSVIDNEQQLSEALRVMANEIDERRNNPHI